MRHLTCIFICIFFVQPYLAWGQSNVNADPELNPLRAIIRKPGISIQAYRKPFEDIVIRNLYRNDTGNAVFKEAITLAAKAKDSAKLAWSKYYYAFVLFNQQKANLAFLQFKAANGIFTLLGDQRGMLRCTMGEGQVYLEASELTKAAYNSHTAYRDADKFKDTLVKIIALKSLGFITGLQHNYQKTIAFYNEGIELAHKTGWYTAEVDLLRSLGNAYQALNKTSLALANFNKAYLLLNKHIPANKYFQAIVITEIGLIEAQVNNNYNAGLAKYKIAEKIFDSLGRATWSCFLRAVTAEVYLAMGKPEMAMNKAKEGYEMSVAHHLLKERRDILSAMFAISKAQKKYKEALAFHVELKELEDTMISRESIDRLASMELQYSYEKKTLADSIVFAGKEAAMKALMEKKDLQQRTIRNSVIAGFAGTVIFLIFVYRQRNKISKARKKSDALLLNILPEAVAEELKAKGSADAQFIDEVTVLFTDFKGFTRASEKLTPKALVSEINDCFSAFDGIMEKYGVEKIKTIGDSYMAAGGLPTPNQTHATDVVEAALEIQKFMRDRKIAKDISGEICFEIRIGVHTGPVVAGIVGVKKFAYDIWGDTVNTASRMESSGEAGRVNISEATYELVKDKFRCTPRGKIMAKHKGEMEMYFVEGSIWKEHTRQ